MRVWPDTSNIPQELLDEGRSYLVNPFPERTLCNVLREIEEVSSNPRVTDLVCLALVMAKRMDAKLKEYAKRDE
jgi:hypothetical protein